LQEEQRVELRSVPDHGHAGGDTEQQDEDALDVVFAPFNQR